MKIKFPELLAEIQSNNRAHSRMNLANNKFDAHKAKWLAAALLKNTTLKVVNLSGNNFGTEGLQHFIPVLLQRKNLVLYLEAADVALLENILQDKQEFSVMQNIKIIPNKNITQPAPIDVALPLLTKTPKLAFAEPTPQPKISFDPLMGAIDEKSEVKKLFQQQRQEINELRKRQHAHEQKTEQKIADLATKVERLEEEKSKLTEKVSTLEQEMHPESLGVLSHKNNPYLQEFYDKAVKYLTDNFAAWTEAASKHGDYNDTVTTLLQGAGALGNIIPVVGNTISAFFHFADLIYSKHKKNSIKGVLNLHRDSLNDRLAHQVIGLITSIYTAQLIKLDFVSADNAAKFVVFNIMEALYSNKIKVHTLTSANQEIEPTLLLVNQLFAAAVHHPGGKEAFRAKTLSTLTKTEGPWTAQGLFWRTPVVGFTGHTREDKHAGLCNKSKYKPARPEAYSGEKEQLQHIDEKLDEICAPIGKKAHVRNRNHTGSLSYLQIPKVEPKPMRSSTPTFWSKTKSATNTVTVIEHKKDVAVPTHKRQSSMNGNLPRII